MRIKYLIVVFIMIISLTGCVSSIANIADPEFIYDRSSAINGIALGAVMMSRFLDGSDAWTPELKHIWSAYYSYYLGAQHALSRGDADEFDKFLDAASKQIILLQRAVSEI